MLPQEAHDLFLFVGDARPEARIGHVIARARIAKYDIPALVKAALDRDRSMSFLCSASEKILFLVIEHVEQHPRYRLDNRRLPSPVYAGNSGRSAFEAKLRRRVRLNVLKFDLDNMHALISK